jgi:hypothetical protein
VNGREIIRRDVGGWISGPSVDSTVSPRRSLPALLRLIEATERWSIEFHADLAVWSAERVEGSSVRYLVAVSTTELAAKIEAAEESGDEPR